MTEPYIGQIIIFAGNFTITGYAMCNGQLLSIAQNTALFSILGTTYGGDGVVTFALPDLRGRVPVHFGTGPGLSPYALGQMSGTEEVTLLTSQLPPHNHTLNVNSGLADSGNPANNILATESVGGALVYSNASPNAVMNIAAIGATGSGLPVNNLQPYLALNFLIALYGIFPSHA